jgi:hypothetical protein
MEAIVFFISASFFSAPVAGAHGWGIEKQAHSDAALNSQARHGKTFTFA